MELYSLNFREPMPYQISFKEAQMLRERYMENPELDWNAFFKFVAHELKRDLTPFQLFQSRIFNDLLRQFKEHLAEEEKYRRLAERIRRIGEEERKEKEERQKIVRGFITSLAQRLKG